MSTTAAEPHLDPNPKPPPGPADFIAKGLKAFASLQLTVVLFALGILLIFFGTVAQMDNGVWTVVDQYFWSWVVMVPFELLNKFGQVFFDFSKNDKWEGSFPFPGGKLVGGLMLLNLLAAHLVRFKLSWKRSGILLIHGGLILLFVGEFITREYAVEQRMVIPEGEAINYTEDARRVELAIVDKSDPAKETVALVPESMLRDGGRIADPQLPFDVEIIEFMANSELLDLKPGDRNPADSGYGTKLRVESRREGAGVSTDAKVDIPAAYVRFFKKGTQESLGTFLFVSKVVTIPLLERPQEVTVDGKKYDLSLRPKRYYKPYTIYLKKFTFDRYLGTQTAKNYSSDLIIKDEDEPLQWDKTVRMNAPMRHRGETFYQGSFLADETTTVLQVVNNPGWLMPYISCVMVSLGMIVHFGMYLTKFLSRRRAAT